MVSRFRLLAFIFGSLLYLVELSAQELYVEPLKHAAITKNPVYTARLTTGGGLLALAGHDKSIIIIDPVTLREKYTLTGQNPRILTLAFTADGKNLVSAGSSGLLSFWSVADSTLLKEIPAHGQGLGVRSIDIDVKGRIVSGGGDGEIKLWTTGSDDPLGKFPNETDEGEVLSVAFNPAGSRVAVANADGVVRIFDPQTFLLLNTLKEFKNKATVIAFSPNGKYLAVGGADSTIRVWDGQNFSLLQTLRGNSSAITSLAFNPNNAWLAATGRGITIWDVTTGVVRKSIADTGSVYTVALFLPDSSTLIGVTASGTVKTFSVLTQKPDREPPTIVLLKPVLKDGDIFKLYANEVEITGVASDESGVKEATVAGQPVKLTELTADEKSQLGAKLPSKKFSAIAPLPAIGANDIPFTATDERGNVATKNIRVQRLAKEAAVEILTTKETGETDQASENLEFKVWFDYTRYTITLNTIEIANKENIPRKPLGVLQSEPIPLSSGFNQVQFAVYGKNGEKISRVININRRILTNAGSMDADKPQHGSSGQPQQWAVVIGISEYLNPLIKNLSYADRDARDFAEFLKSPAGGGFEPDRMKILLNKDATLQNVKQALYNFLRQTIDKDLVIIYFAGHGAPEPANPSNNYLLTYDSDPNSLETSAFPMWDVNTALTRYIPSKHVIVFSDACHSGGISSDLATRGVSLTETNLINQYLADLSKSKEGIIVFTASQAGEVSQELDKFGHGVFTYYLLQGMKGEADINNDYTVTIGELMDYVEENVKRQTKGNQHPTRNQGNYDKDMTISIVPH